MRLLSSPQKDNLGPLEKEALGRFVAPLRVRIAPSDWDHEERPVLLLEDANEIIRLELLYPEEEEVAFLRWAVGMWNQTAGVRR